MIINDHHRFIFLHVPKAGGTSLTESLAALPGDNRKLVSPRTKHETLEQLVAAWPARCMEAGGGVGDPLAYSVFGFVRHPWERMVSLYRYLVEQRPRSEIDGVRSFEDFLLRAESGETWIRGLHSMRRQRDFFLLADGRLHADFIGNYEHLTDDLAEFGAVIGLPPLTLPHRNRSSNSEAKTDYRAAFTDRTAAIIATLFADDIALFNYRFETRTPIRRAGLVSRAN
jgi:hypothetical protein